MVNKDNTVLIIDDPQEKDSQPTYDQWLEWVTINLSARILKPGMKIQILSKNND